MPEPLRFIEAAPDAAIACTLTAEGMRERGGDWAELLRRWRLRREDIEGGARLWFRAEVREDLERLIEAESACCSFFDFRLASDDEVLRLEVRAPAEGRPFVDALFGTSEASDRA
ncbi:MAG: hypothetical protein GEU80_16605 [Dehalococcoidia bacterium]|nr:hypothetical protein [Dehalococcoidia bacterium]